MWLPQAADLIDLDESAIRQQQEEEDLDGVANEEAIQTQQKARRRVTHALGQQWGGLRDYTERPLSDLRTGISLSLETAEHMQAVGYGVLEELVHVGWANASRSNDQIASNPRQRKPSRRRWWPSRR